MRYLLLACSSLLLASCAAQHQLTPQRPPRPDTISMLSSATASTAPYEASPGSIAPPLGFDARGKVRIKAEQAKAKALRKWHNQFQRQANRTKSNPAAVPRKCKGCTFNTVAGNQTNAEKKATVAAGDGAVASHIEKRAGPSVVGSDSVSQNTVGTGNLAATNGDGNTTTQTKADVEPPGVGATIAAAFAKPAGKVVAGLLLLGAAYGAYRLWPVLVRKKTAA